jgi:hypothetical protein
VRNFDAQVDARRQRQAENEMLFRSINERIEDLSQDMLPSGGGERAYDFVCECQNTRCTRPVALTVREYESIRTDGRRFFVAPAPEHVDLRIENVVDRSTRYWVVEKIGESGEIAEAENPRE